MNGSTAASSIPASGTGICLVHTCSTVGHPVISRPPLCYYHQLLVVEREREMCFYLSDRWPFRATDFFTVKNLFTPYMFSTRHGIYYENPSVDGTSQPLLGMRSRRTCCTNQNYAASSVWTEDPRRRRMKSW